MTLGEHAVGIAAPLPRPGAAASWLYPTGSQTIPTPPTRRLAKTQAAALVEHLLCAWCSQVLGTPWARSLLSWGFSGCACPSGTSRPSWHVHASAVPILHRGRSQSAERRLPKVSAGDRIGRPMPSRHGSSSPPQGTRALREWACRSHSGIQYCPCLSSCGQLLLFCPAGQGGLLGRRQPACLLRPSRQRPRPSALRAESELPVGAHKGLLLLLLQLGP